MKFDKDIASKYRQSIDAALATIFDEGNAEHRRVAGMILESEMLICVYPVSRVNASGITGLINPRETNEKIHSGRLSLREAFGEIFITIAEETIDTGGQRGCEGTFVHEGRHAFDFAQVIESFSYADVNPLRVFNPTLYQLEWEAHRLSGEYMLRIARDEYLEEGLQLMILERVADGGCMLSEEGIRRRLRENYGLEEGGNQGRLVSQILGLAQR